MNTYIHIFTQSNPDWYVCMYVCMYVDAYVYDCVKHVYVCICIHARMNKLVHPCSCSCVYACMCMYAYTYVCLSLCIQAYTHIR